VTLKPTCPKSDLLTENSSRLFLLLLLNIKHHYETPFRKIRPNALFVEIFKEVGEEN
jgi:hypothetical protein